MSDPQEQSSTRVLVGRSHLTCYFAKKTREKRPRSGKANRSASKMYYVLDLLLPSGFDWTDLLAQTGVASAGREFRAHEGGGAERAWQHFEKCMTGCKSPGSCLVSFAGSTNQNASIQSTGSASASHVLLEEPKRVCKLCMWPVLPVKI